MTMEKKFFTGIKEVRATNQITPMKKTSSSARNKVREAEPFDKRRVNLGSFKSDIKPRDWERLGSQQFGPVVFPPLFFNTIDTLSPTKTVGKGRTNTTIIAPTIVQTDAATPMATFDRTVIKFRNPIIQIHFEPGAYGITSVSDYVITFFIQVFGQGTFNLQGFASTGTVVNAGAKTLRNQTSVSLIFQNLQPTQQTFAFLEQTAGPFWNWFSTRISFPPIIIQL